MSHVHALRGLDKWVERLSEEQIPALSNVVSQLKEIAENDVSTLTDFSQVILRDPAMTSRVIKWANSALYNPSHMPINTVSRALVLIGIQAVNELCMSSKLIEGLLEQADNNEAAYDRLLKRIAQSFHAAMQSKHLILNQTPNNMDLAEEAFVSGLLCHLGELLFWSLGGKISQLMDAKLRIPDANTDQVTQEVLGTTFNDLDVAIAGKWNISEALQHCFHDKNLNEPITQAIILGDLISRVVDEGWEHPELDDICLQVSDFLDCDIDSAKAHIQNVSLETVELAKLIGTGKLSHFIVGLRTKLCNELIDGESVVYHEPNSELQLQILREASAMLNEKVDLNLLLHTIMEGLNRGIGLDRVAVALISRDKQWIQAKYAVGSATDSWAQQFRFNITDDNLFSMAFKAEKPIWKYNPDTTVDPNLYTPEVLQISGGSDLFIAPLKTSKKTIGLLYADRRPSGRCLNREDYLAFQHFSSQANLSLMFLEHRH